MCRIYQRRRDLLVAALRTVGMHVEPPKGTIYLWVPVPEGYTSASFTEQVLEQADVIVSPGAAYGPSGEGYVRFSLTVADARLQEAVRRIEERVRLYVPHPGREAELMGTEAPTDNGATEVRPRPSSSPSSPAATASPARTSTDRDQGAPRSADMDWVADVIQHRDPPNPRTYLGTGKLVELKEMVAEQNGARRRLRRRPHAGPGRRRARRGRRRRARPHGAHPLRVQQARALPRGHHAGAPRPARVRAHAHARQGPRDVPPGRRRRHARPRRDQAGGRPARDAPAHPDAAQAHRAHGADAAHAARKRLRTDVPLIALAGYTNAGKSTLLNALTDADVSVRDRLFETLDPTSRSFRYRDRDYVLTDTVGFIRKLPHQLVDAFASTLEETTLADVVLVVADASLDPAEIAVREQTVAEVLDMIGCTAPRLIVFNKIDRLDEAKLQRLEALYPEARVRRRGARASGSRRCRSASAGSSTAPCARSACCSRTAAAGACTGCAAWPATSTRSTRPRAWSSRPGCPQPRPGATHASASSPRSQTSSMRATRGLQTTRDVMDAEDQTAEGGGDD